MRVKDGTMDRQCAKKEQPKEETLLQKRLTWEVLHKESHKTTRHNTNKKAKDMDLAPNDKPIKTT